MVSATIPPRTDERGGYYAIGLDGDKRKIDAMTSNMGQLFWSGIVPRDRATIVVRQLMDEHMFSGWGVRTTSTLHRGFTRSATTWAPSGRTTTR